MTQFYYRDEDYHQFLIDYPMLPDELLNIKQFTYSRTKTDLKVPTYTKYKPEGALTIKQAMKKAGPEKYVGFYVTEEDPYFLIDVDHMEDPEDLNLLPERLRRIVDKYPTHAEVSPSGKGLRFIYKLPKASDKKDIGRKTCFTKEMGDLKKGLQVNFGPPWMTITQNYTSFAISRIATVTLEELDTAFTIPRVVTKLNDIRKRRKAKDLPSFSEMRSFLSDIPLDQNPRVQRAYEQVTGEPYQHYDFWVRVLMSLKSYADATDKALDCFDLAVAWSERDQESFSGESDVQKHWESMQDDDVNITYRTLIKISNRCSLTWPVPKSRSQAEKDTPNIDRKPVLGQYANFEALVTFYNIEIHLDATNKNLLYITGDSDIVEEFFQLPNIKELFDRYWGPFDQNTLSLICLQFIQDKGFIGIGLNRVKEFVAVYVGMTKLTVNFLELYFNTPFEKLPRNLQENAPYYKQSTFDMLWECMILDVKSDSEIELCKTYYKKWWYGFIRNVFYSKTKFTNNCILVLTGPEQIRKTSHFRYLLPKPLQHMISFTTHGFANDGSVRDIVKISSTNRIVVWDEFEQYLNAETESNFKKVIDGIPQQIIDKYQVNPETFHPIAIYGATSNQSEFKISSLGARRIFNIPLLWVHTEKMDKICWHPLLNQLRKEFDDAVNKGKMPWLLNETQLQLQLKTHRKIRSSSSIDMIIEYLYDFDVPFDSLVGVNRVQGDPSGRLCTVMRVKQTLNNYGLWKPSLSEKALLHSLERHCSAYTNTERKEISIERPKCVIRKGRAWQSGTHAPFVLPPVREEAIASKRQERKDISELADKVHLYGETETT